MALRRSGFAATWRVAEGQDLPTRGDTWTKPAHPNTKAEPAGPGASRGGMRRALGRMFGRDTRTHDGPPSTVAARDDAIPRPRLCRLAHVAVVLTNVAQIGLMIIFLSLLLLQLNGELPGATYACIFTPLWASDAITFATGIQEVHRLRASGSMPRNVLINQLNRFKGCACVAAFKALLALRLDAVTPDLPMRVIASPYYLAAVLRLILHFCKEPVASNSRDRRAVRVALRTTPAAPHLPRPSSEYARARPPISRARLRPRVRLPLQLQRGHGVGRKVGLEPRAASGDLGCDLG